MSNLRYQIIINFKNEYWITRKLIEPVNESVKTLIEAKEYKTLIDDTVLDARVVDNVTGKVMEVWK